MGGSCVHGPGDDRTHRRKSLIGCFPHRIASQRLSEFQFQTTSHRIVPPETKSNRIVGELWGSGASRGGSAVGQSCGGELRICQHINANFDVEGLCRKFLERVQLVVDAEGGRIKPYIHPMRQ